MAYKVTMDVPSTQTLMGVNPVSEFSKQIHAIFAQRRPLRIIETGTFMGTGTTAIIGSAMRAAGLIQAEFFSIEVNPQHYNIAIQNVWRQGILARVMLGLSIPRALLLSKEQIKEQYVDHVVDGVFVDWRDGDRAEGYFRETDYSQLPEDLLGKTLAYFGNEPDFVLLDSAGHLGHVEFKYTLSKLKGPCVLALDDVRHVKHYQSVLEIKADSRFKTIAQSDEKFGFFIAEFTP